MDKESKVLMDTYKGFEIFYDKDKERFVADNDKLDIHFKARTLWEMKETIKETQLKEVNKEYIIVSGYFNRSLSKIQMLTLNKSTKRAKFKVLDDTEKGYDVGKIKEDRDPPKCYPMSSHNLKIYDEVADLEDEINSIENKQMNLVGKLKKGSVL